MGLFSRKAVKPSGPGVQSHTQATPGARERVSESSGGIPGFEPRVQEIGRDLLTRARKHTSGVLSARFYSDKLMEWSMKDQAFKVQLFRFVDAFPMLRSTDDIYEHLTDYLSQPGVQVPATIAAGLKAGGLAKGLAVATMSQQITSMASKFIAGTDAKSALGNLADLWKDGIAFSVDLLGEACVSDAEAAEYQRKYLDLVNNLPGSVSAWKANPRLETDHLGPIARTNVSIKVSSLSARVDPIDTEGSIRELMGKIVPILEAAKAKGVLVNFDMEQYALKDLTLELFMRCCEKVDFEAGLAMQAYLKSGEDDARRIAEWAKRTGRVVTVRLVKGAYWDYQVIHAEQMGWPCPVWLTKRQTDACFERMTDIFLDACPKARASDPGVGPGTTGGGVKLALGSHNARSIAHALAALEQRGLPQSAIELQMLHGMADQLKHAAADMGLRVREYVPVGEMIPGMAYLVRRLLENTSNESWLKAGFLDNADPAELLASPHEVGGSAQATGGKPDLAAIAKERHGLSRAVEGVGDGRAFFNEPFRDFSKRAVREAFAGALAKASVPSVANTTSVEQAGAMVARAFGLFPAWRDTDAKLRANVLIDAASAMRARRDELSSVMVKEAAKTWREADADTCEAIDFLEYYARESVGLFARERMGRFLGELDEQWHQPRGVAVVISPWNFPLAICCGMTSAALVTGNTVVVKPAEQTPGIAKLMCEILWAALEKNGRPRDVLQFCPAPGETVGAALVRDPRVSVIAFTGSRDVGCDILNAAAPMSPFQSDRDRFQSWASGEHAQIKRVVCEMGGKNALIIDTSADLDEAVLAIRQSAFGFQGQKCSACSRLIVVDPEGERGPAIRRVIDRVVEATRALVVGDPALPGTDIAPVIDREAADKIRGMIQKARDEGCTLELSVGVPEGNVYLKENAARVVTPHVFSGVRPEHTIAREEVFGPVLSVMHAPSFDEALRIANALPYKLTGGVFSRKPSHLEQAKREFRVGNLYLNRGITGALVARQPFGGFAMSGVGSKAGGREYLLQFVEPRASCENTLRRGFAPEL